MHCRLCGFEFDADALACHTGCPFGEKCAIICCPNCGYQVVDDRRSILRRALDRLTGSGNRPTAAPENGSRGLVPLSHVSAGTRTVVRDLSRLSGDRRARLGVFGLAPGESILVVQQPPAAVIQIGETELALELDVLEQIWVDPPVHVH